MIGNILKRDLKRKKTMNIIILLFVILATMFVASSVNNIITILNGTDYYFDQAGVGDYNILTLGENVVGNLDDFLKNTKEIKSYKKEEVITIGSKAITKDGKTLELEGLMLAQSLEDSCLKFFDENNNVVDSVENGTIYITRELGEGKKFNVGDQITIKVGDVEQSFTIKGRLKDAVLGSSFMGNTRLLMSHDDYKKYTDNPEIARYSRGEMCYIESDDVEAVRKAAGEQEGIAFNADRAMIKLTYVMDLVIAAVLIVVSICLIMVSFVVLKFTISFTLSEEFREIGVMKAIGISDIKIRSIYFIKYFAIAVVGACIGLSASAPFGNMLIRSVSENMVLGNNGGMLLNIISAVVVVVVIVGYAFRCTGKIKKSSPLDAIRDGQTGERFGKKTTLRIMKSPTPTVAYMALNDVWSSPKRYLTIILAFTICSLLVFVTINTTETMDSDKLAYTFGKQSDVYYGDSLSDDLKAVGVAKDCEKDCQFLKEKLAEKGYDAKVSVEAMFAYKVSFGGESYKVMCDQGINTKTIDYPYYEGEAPKNTHEVAITEKVQKLLGAKIGDVIKITINGHEDEYLVVGYWETMEQQGEGIRLHEDVEFGEQDYIGCAAYQIDFLDHPSKEEISNRVEVIREFMNTKKVWDARDFTVTTMNCLDMMKSVQNLLLGITLVVVLLVTVLMEKSFISDEKGEIAILKAVGFTDGNIISWHVIRFFIVSAISIVAACIFAVPVTEVAITPIFRMMGMHAVEYNYNLFKLLVQYPGIILVVMMISVVVTAFGTKRITCSDAASIE